MHNSTREKNALIDHLTVLTEEIGPRGSTTQGEARASDYVEAQIKQFGLNPQIQYFSSARSGWYPYALFSGLMIASVVLNAIGSSVLVGLALITGLASLTSILLELTFRANPFRWILPKGKSQNVYARIRSNEDTRQKVILIAHLDSHRTPLVFSSDRWLRLFRVLIPFGLVATVLILAATVINFFVPSLVLRVGPLILGISLFGILVLTLQADRTPFTAGANDNASGAAVLLDLANNLAGTPLRQTEVWVLFSGCEEVGAYGADAFARAHADSLAGAAWITMDTLGSRGGQPSYIAEERFFLPVRSDPALLDAADAVAASSFDLEAHRVALFQGAYTEGSIGARHGFPVLTLLAFTEDGRLTEWHRPSDTLSNLDLSVVRRCRDFIQALLIALDE